MVLWLCALTPLIGGAPADARTAAPATPGLPTQTQIASAIDLAAAGGLPSGYPSLDGAPSIPPVLLKAIAWVESNWRQFRTPDHPLVTFDRGYGVMQVTRGEGGDTIPAVQQSAIANNFIYNIAAGARVLSDKWATTPPIGAHDPAVIEDWYYAVWAYNGWGWANNPRNPRFTRRGTPRTNPPAFPYQERVFYLIAHPPTGADGRPLWTPVPVSLPDVSTISANPGPLPGPSVTHADVPSADAPLVLPGGDGAAVEGDLTLVTGATALPGAVVHKEWLIRNMGGTFWTGYTWRFVGGDRLAAPPSVSVPFVPPLADVPVGVNVVAPSRPAAYAGSWQLFDPAGQPVGQRAILALTVISTPTVTTTATIDSLPTVTPSPQTLAVQAPATSCTGVVGAHVSGGADDASFVADVTIPDGTVVAPGQTFTKTWAIQNTGTSTWNGQYHWTFEAGSPMGRTRQVAASTQPPGGMAQFSVTMTAPTRPRCYVGYWQMTGPTGQVFGTQAWVSVRVQSGAQPTATSPAVPTVAATVAPAPTPTATPLTPTATATATPSPVPWFGPLRSLAFFAEGYTGSGYQEYLSLFNPRSAAEHVQVTVYRSDGAIRVVTLRIPAVSRQTLDVNALAPRAGTALRVAADGTLVAERAQYHGGGAVVAGAPAPNRQWYVADGYVGNGFDDQLRLFNPGDEPSAVRITAYRGDGSTFASQRIVPARTRISVLLDDVAPPGPSGLSLSSTLPMVVESVVGAAARSSVAMGVTAPSRQWYFPDGGTSNGNREFVSVLNPGTSPATVSLRSTAADGTMSRMTVRVNAHARSVFVVHDAVHRDGLASVVTANHPVVAQEVRYEASGAVSLVDGSAKRARSWALADGYVGSAFKEWVSLVNPGNSSVTVLMRFIGRAGVVRWQRLYLAARRHVSYYVNGVAPNGPISVLIDANHPIVAGRTLIFNGGKGLSTTEGVSLPGR